MRWQAAVLAVAIGTSVGLAAPAPPYSCGPFLQQPAIDGMHVVVENQVPVRAALTCRRADGKGPETVIRHDLPRRYHVFAVDDLDAGAEYRYEVRSPEGPASGPLLFRTLPAAPETCRVIVVGDLRSQPEVWRRVAQRILADEPEALFAIGTGDYPADGRRYAQWVTQVFAPGRELLARLPWWPALGNHERPRADYLPPGPEDTHFFRLFDLPGNERWYRVDYQHLTLLVLDSTWPLRPGGGQYEWLVDQLRSPRQRFTVVALHHPPFTSGPHGGLRPDDAPAEEPIDQARRFLVPLFEMHGVSLVVAGHDHFYERSEKEGVTYAVVGGGGAPLYEVGTVDNPYHRQGYSTHHYAVLQVTADLLSMWAVGLDGQELDRVDMALPRQTVRRRNDEVAAQLDRGLRLAPPGPERRTLAVALANPLAVPLTVAIGAEGNPVDLGPESRWALAPGTTQQAEVALGSLLPSAAVPAWRPGVLAAFTVRLTGVEAGLPLDARLRRRVLLREPVYRAPRMVPPQVDGDLSEWTEIPAMVLDSSCAAVVNGDSYGGDADLWAQVRLGWSAGYLHLAVQVRDDLVADRPGDGVAEVDGVELYFDGRPDSARTAQYGPWVAQVILPAVRPVGERLEGNRGWPAGAFAWKVQGQVRGYDLEASVPHRMLQSEPTMAPGASVHFDFMVNDRDDSAQVASHHRLWSSESAASDPTGFGRIVLAE